MLKAINANERKQAQQKISKPHAASRRSMALGCTNPWLQVKPI